MCCSLSPSEGRQGSDDPAGGEGSNFPRFQKEPEQYNWIRNIQPEYVPAASWETSIHREASCSRPETARNSWNPKHGARWESRWMLRWQTWSYAEGWVLNDLAWGDWRDALGAGVSQWEEMLKMVIEKSSRFGSNGDERHR